MHENKRLNSIDNLLLQFDRTLRTLTPGTSRASRPNPAAILPATELDSSAAKNAANLMRINHTGEVCAQALYQGQALTAKLADVRESMEQAADEETDHLAWCEQRLEELGSRPSLLNPLWYGMSFGLGALAGIAGDKWSLGFVAETENQVCEHLEDHLSRLPAEDRRSKVILEQMIQDERKHGETAAEAGGAPLPQAVKKLMSAMSEVMKQTVYRI